jgi:hypothetical protein
MSNISVQITQDTTALDFLAMATPRVALVAVQKTAFDMVRDVQQSFSSESPSAPGSPPGVDTGALKNSIKAEQTGEMEMTIHDGVAYGLAQEYGSLSADGSQHLPARPFMYPAYLRAVQRLTETFSGVGSPSGGTE